MTRMEWINLLGLFAAIAGGAAYLGHLSGRLDAINPEGMIASINKAGTIAVREIEEAAGDLTDTHERVERLISREWYNVTGNRRAGQCYVNNTDYPLEMAVWVHRGGNPNYCLLEVYIDDTHILTQTAASPGSTSSCAAVATIPPMTRYHVEYIGDGKGMWWELRVGGDACDLQNAACEQ